MAAGLALDLTSTDVEVPHPAGAEMGFMDPMPLVLITTADHKLQLWSLISTGPMKKTMSSLSKCILEVSAAYVVDATT